MWQQMTRRDALGALAAVGMSAFHPVRVTAADQPQIIVDELRVISWKPPLYHGWPTLAKRMNGELLLVFSGGRESHVCPFGRVELMRSQDEGLTWRWPQVLLDSPIDDRDAGVLETARGSILVTSFTSLAYAQLLAKAEKILAGSPDAWSAVKFAEWRAVHNRISDAQRHNEVGNWMIRSTDGGVTWSARYPVPVNSPHGPIQLTDGRVLYAGKELWTKESRIGVCESQDDGQTWTWLATIPTRPGDDPREYHELHAVECADGSLIAHIRNANPANSHETLQSESSDGGKSWTVPHAIGVWGLPSHLLRLKDGRLLMSYGHRRPPFGNQTRISRDNGKSWSEPLTISADAHSGDMGYPSTVECRDGSLVTVWYELLKDSPNAQLRQAKWRIKS
jgi:sialidase-1